MGFQVKAFTGRQGFCVRECSTPPATGVAAAVTRSHPAPIHQTAAWTSTKTEQNSQLKGPFWCSKLVSL
jgi:hypothetical protein